MKKQVWFFEKVDLYEILCPHKYADHIKDHPLDAFRKNDFLFLPSQLASEIYLVAEGKVKIGYYDEEGNEFVKAFLGKGEIFGEISYLGDKQHRDFAQVVSAQAQICKMNAERARILARDYVPFALAIHRKIADNVQLLERRLEILFYKDIRQRLLELLKDLALLHGTDANGWTAHGLTQMDLASLIGTSRKSVSSLLNEMKRKGEVDLERGKFKILDLQINE